ncbi:MAG: ATP-dependent helicase HrpB [Pseudomonadota bacterium]
MNRPLPIETVLPEVLQALQTSGRLVLQAQPGAGKTTRVPLAILEAGLSKGRILMLEPRRLAARAAAERMAHTLGEKTGGTVGYRMRGQSAVGPATRIEVVTEGILTRMLQDTPDLPGIDVVVFDEFHERSLNADLGLALCLDVANALRDDLKLVVMSATLDAGSVGDLMAAPVVTSQGQSFEVIPVWLPKPLPRSARLEPEVAELTLQALSDAEGSALVFLPGEAEIRRTEALLKSQLPDDCEVFSLFGAMDFKTQRQALAPAASGRKVVLATSIAETSLTIEGIRIVVDAGRARRLEFDASSGMSRLVTRPASRAEATQRAGRAGRLAPGVAYKLWTRGEDGALPAFAPAEIEIADLTGFALELANWGASAEDLPFLTAPHAGRLSEARAVLEMLGALGPLGRITPHGRALAAVPLHPRLAHMLQFGGTDAAPLAALLSERDILRGASADLIQRLEALKNPQRFSDGGSPSLHWPAYERVRQESIRLRKTANKRAAMSPAQLAALAYPDRVALRRSGSAPRFLMSGGKGAFLTADDPLAGARLIVATDLDGDPVEARIRQAALLFETELRAAFPDQIKWVNICAWSKREGRVTARMQETFGALVLDDRVWHEVPPDAKARAMLDGVRQLGLTPEPAAKRFLDRVGRMSGVDASFPDFSEQHLLATLEDWLLPFLDNIVSAGDWNSFRLLPALQARLDYEQRDRLNEAVPSQFTTPLGREIPIDYNGGRPSVAVRLQEVFGLTTHPMIAGAPLQVTLLSPARRPIQITDDLPGFWRSSYADVRKDMRGRYPKHPWPEDPTSADPTLRAKRRS